MTDRTMPDAHPLRSGDPTQLSGYEILGRLGEGGQGAVFLARRTGQAADARTADHVAIKLLHAGLTGDDSARARFVRELEVAKRVARFCTAQVLDADVAGDQPYIISEYVPGLSLHLVVRHEGPRTGGALERLAISTLTALMAIHQAGIVHRDFKPHNVMMGPDGPRVIDFGVARALGAAGETQNVGTPAYMAPEHFTGGEVGPATDMFAWGTTMAFAATGRPAFGNDEMASVMHRIITADPDLGDLPSPLRDLVLACLHKEPAERPTAREAQERLVGAATGGPPAVQPLAPLPAFGGGGAPAPGAAPVMPVPLGGSTDPGAMAGAVLPPDQITDANGVRGRTAPQPASSPDMAPQPNGPHGPPLPGSGHNGHGAVPHGNPSGPYGQGARQKGHNRLVPVIAAVAVLAVVGAGSAWAATRSGGGAEDGGPAAAGPAANDGPAEAAPGDPANKDPKKRTGQPQGKQTPGKPSPSQQPGSGQPSRPGQPQAPGTSQPPAKGGGAPPPKEPANKYSPQSVCNSGGHGGGYYVQRSVAGSGGTAYLLYNSSGYNCAVTLKTKSVGKASPVSVWIQRQGSGQIKDGGSFAWYAGPVYVSAAKKCVRFGGDGGTAPYGNCG
ncbi:MULTISPECIES: serine/threonine protein kinase [Thermomonosporaceae]|uniref:serine/threonine protein kinase n=1 Tax=Thermomonosporaceae TaxID=2012 RepID=UPI00255AE67F|nr:MULTISPECIES: serine/threonine protein kinase [Thermomonosporaceae]MDL4772616.1 protein kinase [Actinomadura xylanilytica]